MAEKDNLDIPMIVVVGLVSTALTIATVIGVQALFYSYMDREVEQKVTSVSNTTASSKLAEQDAKLARYGWVSRDKGQVVIPVERAMSITVKEYNRKDIDLVTSPPVTAKQTADAEGHNE